MIDLAVSVYSIRNQNERDDRMFEQALIYIGKLLIFRRTLPIITDYCRLSA